MLRRNAFHRLAGVGRFAEAAETFFGD